MADIIRYFDPEKTPQRQKIMLIGSKSYVDEVEKILKDWIYYSSTGRAMLNEIYGSRQGAKLTIQYAAGKAAAQTEDDLSTAEDERLDAWANNAVADQTDTSKKGTGKGTSSLLEFDTVTKLPAKFCTGNVCPANPRFNIPRFVLFHEMVHSMRHMMGKWHRTLVTMNNKSVEIEEAIAILLTNVFMSEKGDNTLRADHTSLDTFGPDPVTYVQDRSAKTIIDKIKADHGGLYQKIAALKQTNFPFNPFFARDQNP